jgi:uncharacterized protein (DUF697 family)
MPGPLKAANLWRIIRDVDLEAIRRNVAASFELWLISEDGVDAARLRALLGPPGAPHPWLVVRPAAEAGSPGSSKPIAALFVTRSAELSDAMTTARNLIRGHAVPILTVVVGSQSASDSVPRAGEDARVAVPELDLAHAGPIATTLLGLAGSDHSLALGRQLRLLRPSVFQALIEETARANASFALTTGLAESIPILTAPLNLGDIIILTKNQLILSYRIALVAGRDGEPRKLLGEILGVLGGGLLFRQVARQLVGLIPVVGILPKVAIAYGGTWAIGRAMVLWATEGREITAASLRAFSTEGLERGRAVAARMVDQARTGGTQARSRFGRLRDYLPTLGRRPGRPV